MCRYLTIKFPKPPRNQSTIATSATSAKIIATTLIATFIPSEAPADIASKRFIYGFFRLLYVILKSSLVSGVWVSGYIIFEITRAPGAAIIDEASKY